MWTIILVLTSVRTHRIAISVTLKKMAKWGWRDGLAIQCLPHKHEAPSSDSPYPHESLGVAVCACNPSAEEAEMAGSLELAGPIVKQNW